RSCHAATERLVQHEIERAEGGQLVAFDGALHDIGEMRLHALGGDMLGQERVVAQLVRDHRDVGDVALVAGAGMGELAELHGQGTSWATGASTSARGISVETAAMPSRADFQAPPPPAGPLSQSVSTSLPMRIASFSVAVRPITRMRASCGSGPLPTSAPRWTLSTPMMSSRSFVVATPVSFSRSATISSA